MHANLRQVAPKALFHFPLECRVKWFAGAGEGMVHACRCGSSFSDRLRDNALDTRCAADERGSLRSLDLVGNSVCFSFVDVPGLVNLEFGLHHPRP